MSSNIRGLKDMMAKLGQAQGELEAALRQAVTEITAEVTGDAVKRAPVKEGTLKASASFYVEGRFHRDWGPAPDGSRPANLTGGPEVRKRKREIRGVMGFNVPYAARQHEMSYRHPKGGERFYLLNALRRGKRLIKPVTTKILARRGF